MSKVKQAVRASAHTVRDHVREVRAMAKPTAEYLLTTIKGVVQHLEELYPDTGLGESKLELAKDQLESIFGQGFIDANWPSVARRIANIVRIEKLIALARKVGAK